MNAPASSWRVRLVPHAVAMSFGVGVVAALVRRPGWPWWVVGVLAVLGVWGAASRETRRGIVIVIVAVAALGWWWGGLRLTATDAEPVGGRSVAQGVVEVMEMPVATRGGERVLVRALDLTGAGDRAAVASGARLFLMLDTSSELQLGHGVRLRVAGNLRPAADETDPGWWRAYLERRGVVGMLQADRVVTAGRRGGIHGMRDRARDAMGRAAVRGLDGDRAGVVRGMALGGGDALSDETRNDMRDAGIWHLMAVSGQNIAYVSMAVSTLLLAVGVGRRRAAIIGGVAIVAYCLMCDGGPSVARAGVMGVLVIVGRLLSNPADRWYLMIVAFDILVAVQPRSVGDPGLELSFAAVAGLLTLGPPLAVWLSGFVPGVVAELAATALAASIATAPVTILRFDVLSLAGLVANLVAVPLAAPTVVLATVGATLGAIVPALGLIPVWLAGLGADAIRVTAWIAARLPGAAIRPGWPGVIVAILLSAGIVALRRWLWRSVPGGAGSVAHCTAWRSVSGLLIIAVATVVATATWLHVRGGAAGPWPGVPAVTMLDVGQGDATLFRSPDGAAMLVDTGPPGDPAPVIRELRRAGVRRLDLVVVTHPQQDHDGALPEVRARFDVRAVARAAASVEGDRANGDVVIDPADHIRVGAWRVDVLWPPATARPGDPNEASVVLMARAPGMSVLVGGDAEGPVLRRVARNRVDVLKVPHHGSADGGLPAALRVLRPRVAVVSVGASNPHGHPDPGTLRSLTDAGARVLRTDRDGGVEVRPAGGGGLRVVTGAG